VSVLGLIKVCLTVSCFCSPVIVVFLSSQIEASKRFLPHFFHFSVSITHWCSLQGASLLTSFVNINLASVSRMYLPYLPNQHHGDPEIWPHLQSSKWTLPITSRARAGSSSVVDSSPSSATSDQRQAS
ncbi:hypothetical protein DSO57_1036121, partial [Entomophthora muscae]